MQRAWSKSMLNLQQKGPRTLAEREKETMTGDEIREGVREQIIESPIDHDKDFGFYPEWNEKTSLW